MKRFFALVLVVLLAALSGVHAEDFDEQYLRIYSLIQEADSLTSSQPGQALAKYREAQTALQQIQKAKPDWNTKIVSFRLDYLAAKIAELSPKVPASAAPAPESAANAPAAAQPAQPAAPRDWQNQLNALKDQVSQLQADKGVLEAKLKEALSVQPAEADPRELARAEEKIKNLQKENDLLKVSVEKQKTNPAADPKALEQVQKDLAEANRQLAEQKALVARLAQERTVLETRLKTLNAEPGAAAALRAENQLLKKQLAELKSASSSTAQSADAARKLAQAQAQIAALQSDKEILRLERIALENRVKQLTSGSAAGMSLPAAGTSSDTNRVQQLERERDDLQKKLEAVYKEFYGRKGKTVATRVEDVEHQLAMARARLEVLEARQVPYSAEELELFNKPAPILADANAKTDKKSIRELSPAAAQLVVEARRYFEAGQYDKAEQSYQEVLREDQKNVSVLANLANIQLEANHLDAAETTLKQALELAPDSAYSLSVQGRLRFRQGKYDEALDALSRAAKLDPQNAEIQNFLGLTLSQKGLRGPAETALRKAIQLEPNYASAHNNLAVVYISQQPPAVELARWHYQKALAAGFPHNANLEKMLEEKK